MRLLGCFEYNQATAGSHQEKALEGELELPGDGEAAHMAAAAEEEDDSDDE